MNPWILSITIAYLLGSIPFGYLLVRIFRNQDIREQGSGNIGATNVARSGSKGLGLATLLLDLGKAYAGVMIAKHLAPGLYDVAVGSGDLPGVRSGVRADAVRFAGIDRGVSDVSAFWALFCGVAHADGAVWICIHSAAGYREAPREYTAASERHGEPVWA